MSFLYTLNLISLTVVILFFSYINVHMHICSHIEHMCSMFTYVHRTYVFYVWLPGGFPGGSYPRESACNTGDLVSSWVRKIPWRRAGDQPTPVILPGESHGQRNLQGYYSWGCKESDITEQLTLSQGKLLI